VGKVSGLAFGNTYRKFGSLDLEIFLTYRKARLLRLLIGVAFYKTTKRRQAFAPIFDVV
jgi:hypothetical protein